LARHITNLIFHAYIVKIDGIKLLMGGRGQGGAVFDSVDISKLSQVVLLALGEMQTIAECKPFFVRINLGLSEATAQSLARAHGVREKWPRHTK
jgi:hypothetical protein